MSPPATPDVENDVLDLLASQGSLAAVIIRPPTAGANAYAGQPKPSKDSGIPTKAVFAEYMGEIILDQTNDGNRREFLVDIVVRGSRNDEKGTRINARLIEDAVTRHDNGTFGQWTAPVSNVKYIDLVVDGVSQLPILPMADSSVWIVHLKAWFDG